MAGDIPVTLKGAMTALITPFDLQGAVDFPALEALVERQVKGGIDGLVPCGTTGESATMSKQEQLDVIRCVVDKAAGRVPIIAGTGSNDTRKSVEMTQAVSEIPGVDAALVVCPYYNKPNQAMLATHFTRVADEGGLPVVLYNVPGRTVISLTPETIASLADHPQIIGIKEATGDMLFDTRMMELVRGRDGFALLSGDDFTTMPFVAMGGHGCISVVSNLLPGVMSELVSSAAAIELDRARTLHFDIQRLATILFTNPNPVPTKEVAHLLGWCEATVRAPLQGSASDFIDELRAMMKTYPSLTV
jgi:4-hydroxy-tetrahydrodipicolinate synthase